MAMCSWASPESLRTIDVAVGVGGSGCPITQQIDRTVEVDEIAQLTENETRRHCQRSPAHATDHETEAALVRRRSNFEAARQPAALVELEIDDVEAFEP